MGSPRLFNPVITILHNTKGNTWHPILFVESPLPGNQGPVRHKSKGHQTVGLENIDECIKGCEDLAQKVEGKFITNNVIDWDGEDVPAMVCFFEGTQRSADNKSKGFPQ